LQFFILANDRFIFNINLFCSDFWSIVLAGKSWPGVLNKDPSPWQDGTRPANTCISPPFKGMCMQCTHPKNTFASIKIELDKKKK
jgi:hypothetical protein